MSAACRAAAHHRVAAVLSGYSTSGPAALRPRGAAALRRCGPSAPIRLKGAQSAPVTVGGKHRTQPVGWIPFLSRTTQPVRRWLAHIAPTGPSTASCGQTRTQAPTLTVGCRFWASCRQRRDLRADFVRRRPQPRGRRADARRRHRQLVCRTPFPPPRAPITALLLFHAECQLPVS